MRAKFYQEQYRHAVPILSVPAERTGDGAQAQTPEVILSKSTAYAARQRWGKQPGANDFFRRTRLATLPLRSACERCAMAQPRPPRPLPGRLRGLRQPHPQHAPHMGTFPCDEPQVNRMYLNLSAWCPLWILCRCSLLLFRLLATEPPAGSEAPAGG